MLRGKEKGFTTIEALLTLFLLVVVGVASFIYFNNAGQEKHISPQPTVSPTTLSITKESSVNNQPVLGPTHKVTDTNAAAGILADIYKLPKSTGSGCKTAADYTLMLHFADPDISYEASYGGCYLVKAPDKNVSYVADPHQSAGNKFWSAVKAYL